MLVSGLLALAAAQAGMIRPPAPRILNFSIRADPSVAPRVNKVLAEVAEPARTRIAATADPAATLEKRCGGFATPNIISIETDRASTLKTIVHQPCLAFRQQKDFVVRPGYTIQELALASGLRQFSTETARVQKKGSSEWERANAKSLTVGDKVRFSKVPIWTKVQVRASKVPDRAALIHLIAQQLDCGKEDDEGCARRRGIDVADDNAAASRNLRLSPPRTRLADAMRAPPPPPRRDALPAIVSTAGALAYAAMQPDPAPAAGPSAEITDEIRATAPIAADQWPYDRARVAAILSQEQTNAREVIVGVADAGLGKADGSPLPDWIFFKNAREDPQPDGNDDDENTFVDDIVGAGVARADDEDPTGDLGVCPPAGVVSTLTGETRATADHGAIVSSIATGLDIHRGATLSVGLPRLVFFRLLGDLCTTPARLQVTEADFLTAMDYVFERAPVLVLSYTISGRLTPGFVPAARNHLDNLDKLLIIPAGNDGPGDLDQDPRCPACLANPSYGVTAARTLVIGTALRDLTIAPFSNWGKTLVHLFAPGEPSIAVDILGRPASAYTPATSWSAPYAGLAAGMIQSLGPSYMPMRDIRERLIASSWPLRDPEGKVDPATSGILNLTAAAAVRHAAIEVVEKNASGSYERRTYVGQIQHRLAELCPEGGLGPAHAIRFGAFNGDRRQATARSKTYDTQAGRFPVRTALCTLPERIEFKDVVKGDVTFDSAAVTQVLLPWN